MARGRTPKPRAPVEPKKFGRGSGNPEPVDVFVGARIRQRRNMLGMNQQTLADTLGLTFQQVQKYEGGANRVSASRLSQMAQTLGVEVGYFFAGLSHRPTEQEVEARLIDPALSHEAIGFVREVLGIGDEEVRTQFQELVHAIAARGP